MTSREPQHSQATGVLAGLRADLEANGGSVVGAGSRAFALVLRALISPAIRACLLIRLAARSGPGTIWIWRNLLITLHGIEARPGASIGPGLRLPHPYGLVIGATVRTGSNVELSHNITLQERSVEGESSMAPIEIADDVTIYTGTTVSAGVRIGKGAVIGAHALVSADVEDGGIVHARTHHDGDG